MNDVNNRIFREFTEFFDNVEKSASEISVTTAYEITMKSTISTAIIILESEGRLEERYWNHLRVQNEQFPRRHFYVPFGEFVHLHMQYCSFVNSI